MQVESASKVQLVAHRGAHIYLITTESGYILVDTGMSGLGRNLDALPADLGFDSRRTQLIVATHGQLDHIGAIAYAQQVTGGRVL